MLIYIYLCHHVNCPLLLSDFNETFISRQVFEEPSIVKSHKNTSSERQVVSCRQTGMKKLKVVFRNFVNEPKYNHQGERGV
jgi:hypothetical protein